MSDRFEVFSKPSQPLTGEYLRYLEELELSTLDETLLSTFLEYGDESGDCGSPLRAEATINCAEPINATPSGSWEDFNTIYNRWLLMSKSPIFCRLLIGQEPNPSDYPDIP